MRLEFDLNNNVEKPELVLGKRNYDKYGSVVNFDNLTYDYNLMSADSISFTVYKELNYEKERLWDEIKERRLIWLKEFNEWFQIDVVVNDENGITKEITGTSLCEAELGQILLKSTEINTENDIAREDYVNPTVFYKPSNTKESLLHRLLKEVPNYSIKYVDESLWNIQRTFSIDGTSVYDTLTGEIAEEIGCLFLFDSTDRSISVYDLKTNCNHCGYRGDFNDICPECGSTDLDYGYGRDTTIFVDSETLAENISLSGKQDEVKNYIKVSGGDDVINAAIAACNPTGTQYIYTFSERDKEDMSDDLLTKLDEYAVEYDTLTPTYQSIMKDVYDAIDEQLYLESTMMPDIEAAKTSAQKELAKLTSTNLSPVAVQDVSIASVYTVNNAVIGMAKCIVNSTVFKIEIIESSFTSQTWKGKFRVTNYSDEEDTAENTGYITITINDDYAYYVEQKIKKTIDRDDVYLVDMFDSKTDLAVFKEELKKYCLSRLNSFESAYQTIIDVLIEANCSNDSTYGDIYNDLYMPYYNKLIAIQSEIKVRASEIEIVDARLTELEKSRSEITEHLNIQNYLGDELWKELCSFRREDSYENSNYISDGLDNSEILAKAQELFNKAKSEAATTSTLQMSLSTTMFNLLAIPEFQKLTGQFEGGNWIRIGLDDKIYRLRLVHYKIDFSEIQNIEVEFSDVTQTANGLNDTKSLMDKVTSMATNFSYVAHQAEQGSKSFTELDKIRNDGLNAALYNISNSINQDFIIDEHGITGRKWDDILGDYSPEQLKINNNIFCYTDNYWQTVKSVVGKIEYYNPILKTTISQYGVICDAVISGILMSNDIIGGAIYSENYSSTTGTYINLNNGDFTFAGGKLTYDSEKDTLNLTGTITFEGIDYSSPESKKALQDSLGITDVQNDIDEFNNASILTPLEKQNMLDDWNAIQSEYAKNIELAKAFELYTDDSDDSNDNETVISYINAYRTLATQIAKCGLDNLSTSTNIDTRIYTDINNYYSANVDFANLIDQEAKRLSEQALTDAKAYSDNTLNTFINSDYKTFVSDIQTQVDGKSETYYQSTQPYENHLNVANNSNYNKLVGDLWYDSDETSKKTYVYTKIANGSNYDYKWMEMEVPVEIFDMADGKAQIFTSKPSNYNKNDLWLVGSDYVPTISGVKIGYVLVSLNNNTGYMESDWKLSIEYTDDTVANNALTVATQAVSDSVLTPSEKRDLLNEINSIKASYSKYTSICSVMNIAYTGYTTAYNNLINNMTGSSSVYKLDSSVNTNLTSTQVTNFMNYFSNYYTAESNIIQSIQNATNTNVSNAQTAAEQAQADATEALGLLADIASDNKITPVEKLQLEEKYNTIKASHEVLMEKYDNSDYNTYAAFLSYKTAYENLCGMCDEILKDKNSTYLLVQMYMTWNDETTYITYGACDGTHLNEYDTEEFIEKTIVLNSDATLNFDGDLTYGSGVTGYLVWELYDSSKKLIETFLPYDSDGNVIIPSYHVKAGTYIVKLYGRLKDTAFHEEITTDDGYYLMLILDAILDSYTRDTYNSIISNYYEQYQLLTNEIISNIETNVGNVKNLAEEAQSLGSELKKCLGFSTEISSDYVISPYIGGGYLNITNSSYGSVIIDPSNLKSSGYIFGVYDSSNDLVMGVNTSGSATFKGSITSTSGNIGGFTIGSSAIYNGTNSMTSTTAGIYLGTDGIRQYASSSAYVNISSGVLTAKGANISGTITAIDGTIGGWSLNSSAIYRNYSTFGTSGGMYFGTSGLSIGSNFKVTSGGTVTANGTFATDSSGTYAKLSDNSLTFYKDSTELSSFSTTYWDGTSIYGTAVHSEASSKFIAFGNKTSSSDSTYITKFVINYGLNPDGIPEGVIAFDSFHSTGNVITRSSFGLNNPGIVTLTSGRVTAWDGTAWGINTSSSGTGLYVFGNIGCSGTKARVVHTEHYGEIELNAYETATPYFGDLGSGECDENGLCYIYLDEIFKETIINECNYYVFLQQYGEFNVYPIEKNKDYFVVKGEPYQKFDFEIKCRQIGTDNMRLNRVGDRIESEE